MAVFGSTTNTVITKWIMEEMSWEFDITTDFDLPDDGKLYGIGSQGSVL